MHLEFLQ